MPGFVDKVSEIIFNKVKQRQLNKFKNLVNKKEGNITRVSNNNSPQAGNNLAASRQAGTHLPSGEGSNTPLASPLLLPWQLLTFLLGKEAILPQQLLTFLLGKEVVPPRLLLTFLLGKQAVHPRQLFTFFPGKEAVLPRQLPTFLLGKEAVLPRQLVILPPGEGSGNSQAGQVGNHARSDRQGFRHSTGHRVPQASQENSTASQADSTNSWEGNPTPTIPNRLPQESSNEEPNPKWVINLSSKPLIPGQRSVLAKGPNFAVSPKQPPNLEYITAIEAACTKLSQQDAEELRDDINRVLRSSHPPKCNLTKAQNLALRELKRDRDCIVLTTDKGVAMVIMDRQNYINDANHLLNQNTYRSITKDPTNSIKIN